MPRVETRLRADVRIDAVNGDFVGTLALPTAPSPTLRRFQTDDCTVLTRAIAVVIAVSLDPITVAEAERTSPAVPEPAASMSTAGHAPREPEPPQDRAREREGDDEGREHERADPAGARARTESLSQLRGLEGGLRLGAGLGGSLLPAAGAGLSLAPFLGVSRLHVRAVVQYWAPQTVTFDPRRDAAGELQLVSGGVRVCPQLGWDRVRIPLCGGVDAGAMLGRGTGRDLAPPRSARGPWVGAVLEPGVTVGVTSRVSLWLALEGVVSLYRPRFAVEGVSQAWTAGAGALRGLFGVQVHGRRDRPQNP